MLPEFTRTVNSFSLFRRRPFRFMSGGLSGDSIFAKIVTRFPLQIACFKIARGCLLLAAAFLIKTSARALESATQPANYIEMSWDTEAGLPYDAIKQLYQSLDGYLWVGTPQGLARFDGIRFQIFDRQNTPAFANDYVTAMAETADGSLWIGTGGGLVRLLHGEFVGYGRADGILSVGVNCLFVRKDGSLWIVGRQGITRWVNEKFVNDVVPPMPDMLGFNSALSEKDETLWFCIGPDIFRYQEGHYTRYGKEQGLPGARVLQVVRDADKKLIAVTQDGLFSLEGEAFSPMAWNNSLSSKRAGCALLDRDGNLWVGSVAGLDRVHAGTVARHDMGKGRTLGVVDTVLEDREGALWLGTSEGLHRFTDRRAYPLRSDEGGRGGLAMSLAETHDGSIWVSTWGAGVDRFGGGNSTHYDVHAPLSSDTVTAIYEAPDGTMWFGNRGSSVDRLEGDKVSTFVYASGVPSSRPVTSLFVDDDGTLLIGIDRRGLLELRDNEIIPVAGAEAWAKETVWAMHRDATGRLVVATSDGMVERSADKTFRRVNLVGIEGSVVVRDFVETKEGQWWLATDGHGLVRWDGKRARAFGTREGMVANTLLGVVEDRFGFVWVSSPRGLARILKTEFDAVAKGTSTTLNLLTFGRSDGLASGSSSGAGTPGILYASDGRLLVATTKGVAVLNPRALPLNLQPPSMAIENVRADDELLPVHEPVILKAGTRRLELRYTALSLIAPQRLRFRYRLEGLDPDWIEAGGERIAHYTSLPPGKYLFHVIASNNDGVWNNTGVTLAVVMKARFYQTLGFRLALGGLLLAIVASVYWIRVRQLKWRQRTLARANEELNARVQERTAELSRSNQELAQRESLFRLIFEHAPLGVSWHRTDLGREYHFNRAFREILALPAETLPDNSLLVELTHPDDAPQQVERERRLRAGEIDSYSAELRFLRRDGRTVWGLLAAAVVRDEKGSVVQLIGLLEDISARKHAEEELASTHRRFVETSRLAGMAEVATGVLHDVGNVLNSANVSVNVIAGGLRQSRLDGLTRIARLLQENAANLAEFLTQNPQGKRFGEYLGTLSEHLVTERKTLLQESESLQQRIEHIKEIVARQQSFAQLRGLFEKLSPAELVDEALRMNEGSLARHGVQVDRDFEPTPPMTADRHKVLQILINLIRNAKQAMRANQAGEKRMIIRLRGEAEAVRIEIADNGSGIAPDNLTEIFQHGFTTRSSGHGFGLHASANAAREMRGSLIAQSAGPGRGATFVLTLPLHRQDADGPSRAKLTLERTVPVP